MTHDALTILLIEDNPMFYPLAKKALEGHELLTAGTAEKGISLFKKYTPHIVFLDINLPDGNGHDVLKELREIIPDAYVIMLTGSRLIDDITRSYDQGANGYIIKPFSKERIVEAIAEYRQATSLS